jgi:predicted PurR-regulated permease PerM
MLERPAPIIYALLGVALVGIVLALVSWGANLLTPILLAAYITALAFPEYRWLTNRGLRPMVAVLIMLVVILLGGAAIGVLLLISAQRLQTGLEPYLSNLDRTAANLQAALASQGIEMSLESALGSPGLGRVLREFLRMLVNGISDFLLALVLVAFFLVEVPRFKRLLDTALHDVPMFGEIPRVMKAAVAYFGVRTRLNLVTGIGFGVWLMLLGVDYFVLWGVLAFVLSYVPYIGLFTAMVPPAILALGEYGPARAALVIVGVVALNLLVESVLEPSYTGKKLRLSPTVVFISFFLWGWLLGPVGALLSMPITVMLMLVLDENESTRWLARVMGAEEHRSG